MIVQLRRIIVAALLQIVMCGHGRYDCDSIMHYRDSSFRSGLLGGGKTMEAVNPGRCNLRTRSSTPTRADKELIRTLYNC